MEEKKSEIKQAAEKDIMVGDSRLFLDENNIINISLVGDIDEKTAVAIRNVLDKLAEMMEGKGHSLVDFNKTGKISHGARMVAKELIDDVRTKKSAFYGLHPVARITAAFVMGMTRKTGVRFFKAREQALAWLLE